MPSKKITLFYPLINETPFYPPLGFLTISRPFLEAGYQITIIDANIEDNFKEKLLFEVSDSICLGVSLILGNQIKSGYEISCFIKKQLPNIPIVWGGWFPTLMYKQILQDKNIDFIIRGQGEDSFPKLVECIEKKEDFRKIPSLVYREDGKINANEIEFIKNIKPINKKAYQLIPIEKYIQKNFRSRNRRIGYISSIGCYGRCAFCCLPQAFGRNRYFTLSPEQTIDDLKYLVSTYKVNHIDFLDFNFFINKKRAKKILKGICQEKLNITWEANIRVDQILHLDEELLCCMKESGLSLLYIGAESGSNRMLSLIQKNITAEDIEKCNLILKKYNIKPSYSFISGIMNEDGYKDLEKTFNLILRLKKDYPQIVLSFHHYSPWPGTYGFEKALNFGFKPPNSFLGWSKYKTENASVPWIKFSYEMKVVRFFQYYMEILYPSPETIELIKKYRLELFHNILKLITNIRIKYKFYYFDPFWGLILICKLLKKCYQRITKTTSRKWKKW
ncbi:MAG: radical SAM protein [bacterium]|nr:radical SAM protein [bacterium]